MSAPSSPLVSPAYVPYQAYKSKRHSRNLSSSNPLLTPNQSPPPISKPPTPSESLLPPPKLVLSGNDDSGHDTTHDPSNDVVQTVAQLDVPTLSLTPSVSEPESILQPPQAAHSEAYSPRTMTRDFSRGEGSSTSTTTTPKKTTTFRRLQPKASQSPSMVPSRGTPGPPTPSNLSRQVIADLTASSSTTNSPSHDSTNLVNQVLTSSFPATSPVSPTPPTLPPVKKNISQSSPPYSIPPVPPPKVSTTVARSSSATEHHGSPVSDRSPQLSVPSSPMRKPAPYRPGFQPKGVYRPLTDDFLALRRSIHDSESHGGIRRVERTKLERRLEKLITLHFPSQSDLVETKEHIRLEHRPSLATSGHKNRNSFFDFQSLRNLSIQDAGDIWKGVVAGGLGDQTKSEIRAIEQRITPWEDDAAVNKCPLCLTAFHPLTNRKHHCRLCGKIICSLPVKFPQRPVPCSVLFVIDSNTRQIEEVGEGVDYGVKKRRTDGAGPQGKSEQEDKFLKGVRTCQDCRPILLRQQYYQQSHIVPPYVQLYDTFINLEAEIEESLPKFQELLMSLNQNDQPTKEASAARKRLLESFAQYDRLSKKIRALPCMNGPGSSQDRVQAAILTRANLFLQKNMFPLQSLPTPQTRSKAPRDGEDSNSNSISNKNNHIPGAADTSVELDSALARTLQPLLEQEALLETFVEEAQMQRKFEDVKTLKINLAEIRLEIERLLSEGNR